LSPVATLLLVLGAVVLGALAWLVYLSVVLAWGDQKTMGLSYYGLPLRQRRRFHRTLRRHARLLLPALRILGRVSGFQVARAGFDFKGVKGPKGSCTLESFERGHACTPRREDVFVVTQMKCGTTWMQHLVYEILLRGRGDLVETGRSLNALSPWLESVKSVSVTETPLIGTERPSRIIKTHFPASLCPFDPKARYIYVARHPVSCYASCADFVRGNLGSFCPPAAEIEQWFCSSESMWWGSWPAHVAGWWNRPGAHENVLLVRFEDMKADLTAVARRVADFLGMRALSNTEMGAVVEKCGFEYMKRNAEAFEMHPPHLLALEAEFFVSGRNTRHGDVPGDRARRIASWAVEESHGLGLRVEELYPELGADR
jgi:hypothetical protein